MRALALFAILTFATFGCGLLERFLPIENADDLAAALKRRGVAYTETEPLDFSGMRFAKIEEGLRLKGEKLTVEILRIEDNRTFEMAVGAGFLMSLFGSSEETKSLDPPESVVRRPFVVVVRQEPNPGQVGAIVRELIPEESRN